MNVASLSASTKGDSVMKGETIPVGFDDEFTLQTSSTIFGGFGQGPRLAVGLLAVRLRLRPL